jgi:hypothetical protein
MRVLFKVVLFSALWNVLNFGYFYLILVWFECYTLKLAFTLNAPLLFLSFINAAMVYGANKRTAKETASFYRGRF